MTCARCAAARQKLPPLLRLPLERLEQRLEDHPLFRTATPSARARARKIVAKARAAHQAAPGET